MNEMDALFPIPNDQRNADDMGMPPQVDQPAPPPASVSPADFPGFFVELREDELMQAFPGGLPSPGGVYGLLCTDVLKGEGDHAGKFGIGFRYVKVAEVTRNPGDRIIIPGRN